MYVKCKIVSFYENRKGWYCFNCKPLEPCGFDSIRFYSSAVSAMGKTKEDYKIGQIVELEIIPQVYRIFEPR